MNCDYVPDGPNFYGDEWFQITAHKAFPILIDLATDPQQPTMTYGELANEVGGIALNMSRPLGSIWVTLLEYQEKSGIDIPYLTIIIVAKYTELPTWFVNPLNWSEEKIANKQADVYNFQQWPDVKEHLLSDNRIT